jgi:hypothetical protein
MVIGTGASRRQQRTGPAVNGGSSEIVAATFDAGTARGQGSLHATCQTDEIAGGTWTMRKKQRMRITDKGANRGA